MKRLGALWVPGDEPNPDLAAAAQHDELERAAPAKPASRVARMEDFKGRHVGGRDSKIDDDRRGAALALLEMYEGNVSAAARATGISPRTVRRLRDELPEDERAKLRATAKDGLIDGLLSIAAKIVGLVDSPEVLSAIAAGPNPDRLMVMLGIGIDKLQILTGGATSRVAFDLDEFLAAPTWTKPMPEIVDVKPVVN